MRKATMKATTTDPKLKHHLTRKEMTMITKIPLQNLKRKIKIRMALQLNHPHLHPNQ